MGAHNAHMNKAAEEKSGKSRNATGRRVDTYHGTRLPPAKDTERFTVSEIRQAVEAAIDKHRDTLFKAPPKSE